jgi:hypothetical protein
MSSIELPENESTTSDPRAELPGEIDPAWEQGSILPDEATAHIVRDIFPAPEPSHFIVVSQDCDILHPWLDDEPFVELLLAVPLPGDKTGSYVGGRNPRTLHFDLIINGEPVPFQAYAGDRHFLDRRILLHFSPAKDRSLTKKQGRVVVEWLSRRYTRAAFPDAFNARIDNRAQKKIRAAIDKMNETASAIMVAGADEELDSKSTYKIGVVAILPEDEYHDVDRRTRLEVQLLKLEAALNGCPGIDAKAKVFGEHQITMKDFLAMKRWDYDYLSYGADPPAPLITGR